ncbi:hypothetical protein [Alteromonas sp. 14N.309.X.WAT.G.H12]|uniref:hypothetical protein n=1 Tax=Alteromonas sp. 14N.309.X.WAT.G.H12 TaxID=3120824 RepID=UPI002FD6C725
MKPKIVAVKSAHTGWGLKVRKLANHRNPHKGLNATHLNLLNPQREGLKILKKPIEQVTYKDFDSSFIVSSRHILNADNFDGDMQENFHTLSIVADTFFPVARQMYFRLLSMPKIDNGIELDIDRDMSLVVSPPKIQKPSLKNKGKTPPKPR